MGYMLDQIGEPAMYEQMAEECIELAKAVLKTARVLRGENPTPVTEDEAWAMVLEDAADVWNCINEVGIFGRPELEQITYEKLKRFKTRWEEAHRASKS